MSFTLRHVDCSLTSTYVPHDLPVLNVGVMTFFLNTESHSSYASLRRFSRDGFRNKIGCKGPVDNYVFSLSGGR